MVLRFSTVNSRLGTAPVGDTTYSLGNTSMNRRRPSVCLVLGSLLTSLAVACAGPERPPPAGTAQVGDAGEDWDASSSTRSQTDCGDCSSTDQPARTEDAETGAPGETQPPSETAPFDAGAGDAAVVSEVDAVWRAAAPLFASTGINQVSLSLDEEQEEALRADSSVYVHGRVEVRLTDDSVVALDDVGVRLKGQWGSARNLDQKAAFLIKTNEFVQGQKLLGLSKFALNNMVQDPSMLHEQLAYLLFREMGIAAPRTGYANVTFNDELYGLYATVEVVDNESFLQYWYGSDTGNLYEGAYGSDVEGDQVRTFDQDRGEDVGFADLYVVKDALDVVPEGTPFVAAVGPHIDTDWFARFTATELMLAHWDGYAVTRNNYFLYPNDAGLWTFIPWGLDQTFGDSAYSLWGGDARIHRMCADSQDCRSAMAVAYERLLTLLDELDLLGRVDALEALIHDAADADPRKEYDSDSIWSAIESTRQFLRDRPANVTAQLACADPSTVDVDGDGASGCGEDCDDNDPAVFPNAAEACNLADDNCNGDVDESEECPSCFEAEADGNRYAFCFHRLSFAAAQTDCEEQGGDLISIHSEQEQSELLQLATDHNVSHDFWLGLTDAEYEGEFEWVDGSYADYTNWGGGEPNDAGGNEDCAQLTGSGAWNDLPCDVELPYVCQL
jgi:hypothetical protein